MRIFSFSQPFYFCLIQFVGAKPAEDDVDTVRSAAQITAIRINAVALRGVVDTLVVQLFDTFRARFPALQAKHSLSPAGIVGMANSDGASTPLAAKKMDTISLGGTLQDVWCWSHNGALVGKGAGGLGAKPTQQDGFDDTRAEWAAVVVDLKKVRLLLVFIC